MSSVQYCLCPAAHLSTYRVKVAEPLRYQTFKYGDETISFKEYFDRMSCMRAVFSSWMTVAC